MVNIVKDLVYNNSFQKRYGLSDAWLKIFANTLSSEVFKEKLELLKLYNNGVGIYNLDTCFEIFKLIEPEDVKVILFAQEPITSYSSPFPFVDIKSNMCSDVEESIYVSFNVLEQQLESKFKGSTYLKLRSKLKRDEDLGSGTLRKFMRMEEVFGMSKVIDKHPMPTYNWYAQGVLTINPDMVGHPLGTDMSLFFRTFIINLMNKIQQIHPIVIATYFGGETVKYSPYVREGSEGVFTKDLKGFFVAINKAVSKVHGECKIIDFLC